MRPTFLYTRVTFLGLAALVSFLAGVRPAYAQPAVVAAAPAPGQSVNAPPAEVRLSFDHPLLDQGTSLSVTNGAGDRVDNQDSRVDPGNRFELVVTLPPLLEGQYTVTYAAASVGSSTIFMGSYQFTIDLPDPVITLVTPKNGQVFDPGPVPVEFQTQYIDFSEDNSRIRLYVDGALYAELHQMTGQITDLPPGVHELRIVLGKFDGQELPETSSTLYIVIANPDPETAGWAAAAVAPPDPGLQLTPLQLVGVVAAMLVLLGIGLWLGREQTK
jgi:methionine-rich copper-binding protein CopC